MKSCENYAVQSGQLPSLKNISEWGSAFEKHLSSLEEHSKSSTKTEEERFKEVLLQACLISPESVPDQKLRKKMQDACNALIINSWELFEDPDLDTLMCAFQTADIQDEAKRKELDSICIFEMGESGKDARKKLAAAHKLGAFSRSEILPEVIKIFLTTKDPLKVTQILHTLWEEKNIPFVIKLSRFKYKKTNPLSKKIQAQKRKEWEKKREEKREELASFLMREDFQLLMKKYYEETEKWANLGTFFPMHFKNWIQNNLDIEVEKKIEYLKGIDEINKNKVIEHILLKESVKNEKMNIRELTKYIFKEYGIKLDNTTVGRIIKEAIGKKKYEIKYSTKIEEKVRKRVTDLLKNPKLSLDKISDKILNEFGVKISVTGIKGIAKKVLSEKDYAIRFPYLPPIDEETKNIVRDLIKSTGMSLRLLAKYILKVYGIKIHNTTIGRIAKETLGEEEYFKKYPPPARLDEKTKSIIINLIKNTKMNQLELVDYVLKNFGVKVSRPTIGFIGKTFLDETEYDERFGRFIAEDLKNDIIFLINHSNYNLDEIADETGASSSSVRRFALEVLSDAEYRKRFPMSEKAVVGTYFHLSAPSQFEEWAKRKGIKILTGYEILKEIPRLKESWRIPDNLIYVDDTFRKIYGIPPHIKFITVDFTLSRSQRTLEKKSEREYQSMDTLFIHVPIILPGEKKLKINYQVPTNVPYHNNIWVLPDDEFFNFFNFSKEEKDYFLENVREAYRRTKKLKSLKEFL